jgi:2-haloacid dehalogenase
MALIPSRYRVVTFDCYGTLVDWEKGIIDSVRPVLTARSLERSDAEILECYARLEALAERPPHRPYRQVLLDVAEGMASEWGFSPTGPERECILSGFSDWRPFPDTVEALRALHGRYRLAIISNVDDDLFRETSRRLGVAFDWVTTAGQAGSYKPDHGIFRMALERMGIEKERVLHAAQSVYHDVVPASEMGLATVRVMRASRAGEFGVSLPSRAAADATVPDLASLAALLGLD